VTLSLKTGGEVRFVVWHQSRQDSNYTEKRRHICASSGFWTRDTSVRSFKTQALVCAVTVMTGRQHLYTRISSYAVFQVHRTQNSQKSDQSWRRSVCAGLSCMWYQGKLNLFQLLAGGLCLFLLISTDLRVCATSVSAWGWFELSPPHHPCFAKPDLSLPYQPSSGHHVFRGCTCGLSNPTLV
jgi:hypothetical protein